MTLIDHKGVLGDALGVEFISVEKVDEFGSDFGGGSGGCKADVVCGGT